MPAARPLIRPFHPSDLPALYRICLLTGDAGSDATALYRDEDLLGHVYLGPYPTADPTLTFVVVDELGPAGYIVATADTAGFEHWLERAWWPPLRARYPLREDPHDGTEDHVLVARIHDSSGGDPALFDRFPAHMHIDLLPRVQGQGLGRRLVETLATALRARGVPGLYLGVDSRNEGAIAFYDRIGFVEAARHEWGRTLTLDLA
ncbi:GNAT family N-acetyltransferase [Cellulomonas fengjieae]|uniref:GNAT family N-acetyltransferase n=1 Tax=Cellulomonas fengjieae TaxID=2819978 RepID=A0ABS3SKA3_9CELL|nr:GNAT family N-acetyltransferase [Cellulomonas fengjieae]MBO3086176.1 GNAT family N-acetyltransferase [Cellulomonas fengjieae]MBO3102420.1 GNAT family N-acetyltransferase [Cellulomonas fengjieae]QVI65765.1 GNAT family N-acetyltransferase [Cellulomonas fengjieae]